MKKLSFHIAVIFTLMLLFSQNIYASYSVPSFLRIGLYYGSNAKNEVTVYSENGFYVGTYDGTNFAEEKTLSETDLVVTYTSDAITVKNDETVIYKTTDTAKGVGLFPTKGGMDRRFKINGNEYRGGLDFKVTNGSNVITNVVFMDNYLYGVISREMSPSWHIDALKAQAICARNFAICNLNKHKSYGFNLCSTVCCQAYSGVSFETENSYAPVDETSNQILTYDNKPAELYYCASMGKTTENVENVWGSKVPYLVAVDNTFEDTENITNGVWTGSLTCDEATTIMRNKGYNVGEVTSITVDEYTENGRVLKMTVSGTQGSQTFERSNCRAIFNTVTKSQAFTVTPNGGLASDIPEIKTTDGKNVVDMKINELILLTADGRATLSSKQLFVTNGKNQEKYTITETNGGKTTGFTFSGTGWGHSVGMSQYGAKGMAEAGYTYDDILLHYFPGTKLENVN